MPVSLSGLDLSWLKDPANHLPPQPQKRRVNHARARSDLPCPALMPDIAPFVSPVGRDPEVISSRSKLREHEKQHNVVQVGNDFGAPGTIGAKNEAKKAELKKKAAGLNTGWNDFTT